MVRGETAPSPSIAPSPHAPLPPLAGLDAGGLPLAVAPSDLQTGAERQRAPVSLSKAVPATASTASEPGSRASPRQRQAHSLPPLPPGLKSGSGSGRGSNKVLVREVVERILAFQAVLDDFCGRLPLMAGGGQSGSKPGLSDRAGTAMAAAVAHLLFEKLRPREEDKAEAGCPLPPGLLRDLRYGLAGLADDRLGAALHWPGREAWRRNPLEGQLFGSEEAGWRLFTDMRTLLQTPGRDGTAHAVLYLMLLELGFQGNFREAGDTETPQAYRQALIRYLSRRLPAHVAPASLFPGAYPGDREAWPGWRLSPLRGLALGALLLAGLVGGYILASQAIWSESYEPLRAVLSALAP